MRGARPGPPPTRMAQVSLRNKQISTSNEDEGLLTTILHNPTEKHYQIFAQLNKLWILGSISVLGNSRTTILVIRDCLSYNSFQWILDQFPSSLEIGKDNTLVSSSP